jgi:hypothetical protein
MLRIAFLTVDETCRNVGVLLSALRSVTRSRDAQGLGLTADAVRYLRALLRRPLGALAQIPPARTSSRRGVDKHPTLSEPFIGYVLLPPKGG